MKKITAGRDILGEFAPKFAQLNDDVLFGEVWSRESELSARDRSLITVTALMAQGLTDTSFGHHLAMAKENGITRSEIAEILTHAAFYAGWPKAWAAFRMAKEVWAEDAAEDAKAKHQSEMVFPIGASNDGFAPYFSGKSYLAPLSTAQVGIYNVTFEPGCRNNWHIHHAKQGGGQIRIINFGIFYCKRMRAFFQFERLLPVQLPKARSQGGTIGSGLYCIAVERYFCRIWNGEGDNRYFCVFGEEKVEFAFFKFGARNVWGVELHLPRGQYFNAARV